MKLQKTFLLMLAVCAGVVAGTATAAAWGQKGHDVTCAIAERHLTKKAAKEINRILDGKSIVYWANWMDNASHTREFSYTKTWHYKDIDPDETYETAELCGSGDVVTAINAQVKALESGELNKDAEALALKMLVHLVGDVHCPMHAARKYDKGGNLWQVQFFDNGKNLHAIWDTDIVEAAHKWTYTEWADQIDIAGRAGIRLISQGTPDDWCKETHEIAEAVYEKTPVGSKLSYDYVTESTPVVEQQLLRGGIRLAAILNEIFD